MYNKQRSITQKALFDYYMISSCIENEVHSPFPYYIDDKLFNQMNGYANTLHQLVMRIIQKVIEKPNEFPFIMGEFPNKERILSLKCPVLPFFWVRYDAFIREKGGVFFSEFNYDKPCAQREILISDDLNPYNNPNSEFKRIFCENFYEICSPFLKKKEKITVAFLVSPAHDEEMHITHLFMDILKSESIHFLMVSTDNLYVEDDKLKAFETGIDILFRLYPTECLFHIEDIEKILNLHEDGKIQIVNDPRAIIGQTKALFAYLWKLAQENSEFLLTAEKEAIMKSIPYTCLYSEFDLQRLKENKDDYVIKAVFGRYSEQVYIGNMFSADEWLEVIEYVNESEELHIVQEFCEIKREKVLRFKEDAYVYENAFGNFGIYISKDKVCGSCIRWSNDYLSNDDNVWISPIGVAKRTLNIGKISNEENRQGLWQSINDQSAFEYDFWGGYTGVWQSFSLNPLVLDKLLLEEITLATKNIAKIFHKTTNYVQQNSDLLYDVLGIPEGLKTLISQKHCTQHHFIGRFDFVLDSIGNIKLLEFNAETPAGIIESIVLNEMILKQSEKEFLNPNAHFSELIIKQFLEIIKDYEAVKPIKTVAIVSLSYPEDYYNTHLVYDILKHLPYRFVFGEVSGLTAKDEKLVLYGEEIDAIYRYYPLDWFENDKYYEGIIGAFEKTTFCINPPSSFIAQSKAFFALIWELMNSPFYDENEKATIKQYIPFTSLDHSDFSDGDYCFKPYFGREGEGVGFSILGEDYKKTNSEMVFQERIDMKTIKADLYTSKSKVSEVLYPIIGAFVLGETFGGIYTRAGNVVTDKNAVYIPTFVKD